MPNEGECYVIYDLISSFQDITVSFIERIMISDNKLISSDLKFNRGSMKKLMQKIGEAQKN